MKTKAIAFLFPVFFALQSFAQPRYPGKQWLRFQDVKEAGWSRQNLNEAKRFSDSIGLSAVMIVEHGAVIGAWGDVERKYLCHSMRKSFMSALIGMAVEAKQLNLQATLADLNINDSVHPLTATEKGATVQHLLQARSGIYLPAAYEGDPEKPPRGSHTPGTYWFYNNWDFNVLGTILQQVTGRPFFDDLQRRIAGPLQMEDVDSLDVFYKYERERSNHPAYTFKMSTEDLARFGWLYAMRGRWQGRQLIAEDWIDQSTKPYSVNADGEGYGYLWWMDQTLFKEQGMYAAAGMGGHHVFVFPKDSLVVVVRADTYAGKSVSLNAEYQLLSMLLKARTGRVAQTPGLVPLAKMPKQTFTPIAKTKAKQYLGLYQFEGEWMKVISGKRGLLLDTEFMGTFYLQHINGSLFQLKDQETYINFLHDSKGRAVRMLYHDKTIEGRLK